MPLHCFMNLELLRDYLFPSQSAPGHVGISSMVVQTENTWLCGNYMVHCQEIKIAL